MKAADGHCTIEGGSEVGVLYGVFALLRNLQTAGKAWAQFTADEEKAPSNRLRMLNHWDNMDGSIERGYSGDSFFFKDSKILIDVPRLTAYARMLASVGINGITINNVNVKDAASWLITDRYFGALQEYLKIFTPYGVKLYLSINFAAPMELGGMDSADPCDPAVAKWWADKAQEVWANLPGLGGFLVKADSEGRPGPFTYGRNQADGANMLADAVAPAAVTLSGVVSSTTASRIGAIPRLTAPAQATTILCRWTAPSATTSRCKSRTAPWTSRCANRSPR